MKRRSTQKFLFMFKLIYIFDVTPGNPSVYILCSDIENKFSPPLRMNIDTFVQLPINLRVQSVVYFIVLKRFPKREDGSKLSVQKIVKYLRNIVCI
jgi:hypothetical protein